MTGSYSKRAPRGAILMPEPLAVARSPPERFERPPTPVPPVEFHGSDDDGRVPKGTREVRFSERLTENMEIVEIRTRWALNTQEKLRVRYWATRSKGTHTVDTDQVAPSCTILSLVGHMGTRDYVVGDEGETIIPVNLVVLAPFYLAADAYNTDTVAHTLHGRIIVKRWEG